MFFTSNIPKLATVFPTIQPKYYSNLKCAFKKEGIIPDVICKKPKHKACVTFKSAIADLGNQIAPKCTECQPKVKWEKPCGRFVVMMLNPDMETRKEHKLRHWVHWLVGNVKNGKIHKGDTLMEYVGACPAEGTGCHRIVILVYKQHCKLDFCMKKICADMPCGREKFDLKGFTKKFQLCNPYAGNFFITKADAFSEALRCKLREKGFSGK